MDEAILFENRTAPLITLEHHQVRIEEKQVDAAWQEITARSTQEAGFVSGYLLGVEDRSAFPQSSELLSKLESAILESPEREMGPAFSFSFMKGHRGAPPKAKEGIYFEGPHLDSHPALIGSFELLRILINLSTHPRKFRYYKTDSVELANRGVPVCKAEFLPLNVPHEVPSQVIEIPGRTSTDIYALRFWASVVPHVGINEPEGSYLASFESPRPFLSRVPVAER